MRVILGIFGLLSLCNLEGKYNYFFFTFHKYILLLGAFGKDVARVVWQVAYI